MASQCINDVQPLLLYIINALRPLVTQFRKVNCPRFTIPGGGASGPGGICTVCWLMNCGSVEPIVSVGVTLIE